MSMNGMSFDDADYRSRLITKDTKHCAAIAASGQIYEDDPRSRRPEPQFRDLPMPREYDRGGESMS